jgi:integrase
MRSSIKVLFWLYQSKKNAQGQVPIYIRVTLNKAKTEIASGYFVFPRYWNDKKKLVQDSAPQGAEINNALEIQRGKLISIFNQLLATGEDFTLDTIKGKLLGKDSDHMTILQVVEYHNKRVSELVGKSYSKGTYDNYVYLAGKIAGFLLQAYGKKDLPLKALNPQFLSEFEQYLRTVHNNKTNTVAKSLTNFKTIVNLALDMDWITKDPFRNHRNRKEEPPRTYLSSEEVTALMNCPMPNEPFQAVKDCVIFQIYTGLAYADLRKLSDNNIVTGIDGEPWIDLRRQKTGTRTALPLLPQARAILEKYRSRPHNGRILPVISNQKMNRQLKKIVALSNAQPNAHPIDKNISTHSLRRTFATTITLSRGVPIETVSKMLGHSDLKTTAIYAKVVDSKISADMQKLQSQA